MPDLLALLSRDTSEESSSPACLSVGAEWLKSCYENHPKCSVEHKQQSYLPTRVINVGDHSTHPFLHISGHEEIGSWVALSYCWGGVSTCILTKNRLAELQRGLLLKDCPRTIHDAILITRALGVKYLWVDALCIFQSPQDKTQISQDDIQSSNDEWVTEAPKMAEIYRDAVVTIAATASPSVSTGILGKRRSPSSCSLPWRIPSSNSMEYGSRDIQSQAGSPRVYVSCERKPWDDVLGIQQSYWDGRGWTMQENLLASRTLAFTSQQMVWECSSLWTVESECSPPAMGNTNLFTDLNDIAMQRVALSSSQRGSQLEGRLRRQSYNLWYTIVTRYSQRNLSYVADKLPAIAGLAKRVELALHDNYCAGLWRNDLLIGLLWYSLDDKAGPSPVYLGPSWTWAAIPSTLIRWKGEEFEDYMELARVESVDLEHHHPRNIYGQIKYAKLEITAPYYRLERLKTEASERSGSESGSVQAFINQIFDDPDSKGSREYCQQHKPCTGQHFAILQIVTYQNQETGRPAMELLLLESDNGEGDLFRRVGQVSLREANDDDIDPEALPDYFNIGPVENEAWREVKDRKWPLVTVAII